MTLLSVTTGHFCLWVLKLAKLAICPIFAKIVPANFSTFSNERNVNFENECHYFQNPLNLYPQIVVALRYVVAMVNNVNIDFDIAFGGTACYSG